MRLIDSDKIEYMWKLDRNGKFRDGVTLESIVNDMPTVNVNDLIIKELEKIKAEILDNINTFGLEFGEELTKEQTIHNHAIQKDIKLIDKHISELKGK